jgi:predicted  nucleic acid-binding Zn-ribbon protein
MTADDQRTQKALLKLDYDEAKEREALLRRKLDQLADGFINVADRLKKSPENFQLSTEDDVVKHYQELRATIEDLRKTLTDLQGLQRRLNDAGIAYNR